MFLGTIVNSLAIIIGTLIGITFGARFTLRIREMIMQALGLGIVLIGISMAIGSEELILVLVSMVTGGWLGEVLNIEGFLHRVGKKIESRVGGGNNEKSIAQAFVTSTVLFCIGAMAIMGSIESGLTGNHDTLFAKSLIDGITSIMLTATMGIGVIFSALAVLLYQGAITLAAGWLQNILTDGVILELKAVGGLIIFGIGLNILNITKIKVGNLLPAIVIIVVLSVLFI